MVSPVYPMGWGGPMMDEAECELQAQSQKDYIIQKLNEAKTIKIQVPTSTKEEDEEEPEENENDVPTEKYDSTHLPLHMVLPKIATLVQLSLVYETEEVGLDWEQRLVSITDKDCKNLARALAESSTMEIFELNKSHLTGEQCKTLVREGLIHMIHLKSLNLSYNQIGSVGATALARLISDSTSQVPHTLHTLKICRNVIRSKGAKALAFGLSLNTYLTEMDLRLNFIKSPGGQDFGHALATNKSLQKLNIAANRLGPEACFVLGKMLAINDTLLELDVSSNNLESKGGEYLALGMRSNKTLINLDVRLANIGYQYSYNIMVYLRKNREKVGYSIVPIEEEDDEVSGDTDLCGPKCLGKTTCVRNVIHVSSESVKVPSEEEFSGEDDEEEEEEEEEEAITIMEPTEKDDRGSSDSDHEFE